ncbi:hypothetical protein GOBAR_AA09794 [Gossypium barbadense]|uniref:Uncharacterized protein n=1 Tax=Gossypium barbadense TaxID=3634 RepID=A0A2P5Y5K8_GOSBA|nr:hypothetical protein GOBAR_AA09794 [Gossypium barbadense]
MLSKFISVLETHFQNTETALKNQQALIQWFETQIGQLSKLISERPQGSLPSNTEPNLREHLNAISTQDKERFIAPELELMQETMVSKDPHIVTTTLNEEIPLTVLSIFPFGKVEVSHSKFGTFKDAINPHGRATWPWVNLIGEHGRGNRKTWRARGKARFYFFYTGVRHAHTVKPWTTIHEHGTLTNGHAIRSRSDTA